MKVCLLSLENAVAAPALCPKERQSVMVYAQAPGGVALASEPRSAPTYRVTTGEFDNLSLGFTNIQCGENNGVPKSGRL